MEFNTSERRINKDVVEILKPSLLEDPFKGTIKEGCECKYGVINLKDLKKYVDVGTQQDLAVVLDKVQGNIEHGREKDGKKPFNNYIVINIDEPYINEIVSVLERNGHWDGQPSDTMKFYEVHEPYYALIMARNEEEAIKIYTEVVADDDGKLNENINEVSHIYATLRVSQRIDSTKMDFYQLMIRTAKLTPDEVRRLEKLKPNGEESDVLYTSKDNTGPRVLIIDGLLK